MEWRLEKLASESVDLAKTLMAKSEEVYPSDILKVLQEVKLSPFPCLQCRINVTHGSYAMNCVPPLLWQALEIHPNNRDALLMKAKVLYAKGDYKKVTKCIKRLLEKNKDDREARRIHASALIRLGELEGALQELSAAIESPGGAEDMKVWEMRALLNGMMRHTHGALHDINRCLDLSQDTCTKQWYLRRGAAKGSLQDWQESLVDIRRSLAQQETAVARRFAGRIYMCSRRWKDGVRELRAALLLDPDDALAQRALEESRIKYVPVPMDYPEDDSNKRIGGKAALATSSSSSSSSPAAAAIEGPAATDKKKMGLLQASAAASERQKLELAVMEQGASYSSTKNTTTKKSEETDSHSPTGGGDARAE